MKELLYIPNSTIIRFNMISGTRSLGDLCYDMQQFHILWLIARIAMGAWPESFYALNKIPRVSLVEEFEIIDV